MTRKKTRRVYRLRDMLKAAGFCWEWQTFVRHYKTADEVLAAVNADPTQIVGACSSGAAWEIRYAGEVLAHKLGRPAERAWWDARLARYDKGGPIAPEERDRFVRLWIDYADEYGLYETVPA